MLLNGCYFYYDDHGAVFRCGRPTVSFSLRQRVCRWFPGTVFLGWGLCGLKSAW